VYTDQFLIVVFTCEVLHHSRPAPLLAGDHKCLLYDCGVGTMKGFKCLTSLFVYKPILMIYFIALATQ